MVRFVTAMTQSIHLPKFFVHIPGVLNILGDYLSRLDVVEFAIKACDLLTCGEFFDIECVGRMTYGAFLCLQEKWARR